MAQHRSSPPELAPRVNPRTNRAERPEHRGPLTSSGLPTPDVLVDALPEQESIESLPSQGTGGVERP